MSEQQLLIATTEEEHVGKVATSIEQHIDARPPGRVQKNWSIYQIYERSPGTFPDFSCLHIRSIKETNKDC